MCMEDVRLGRETTAGQTIVSVGQTSKMLVGQSPLRTALVISCPTTGYITLSFNSPAVVGSGLILNALGEPLKLDIQHHGAIVKKEIYAIHSAGTVDVCVWDTSLEKT